MYQPNLKSVASPAPEIIANDVLGGVRTPNLGEKEALEVGVERALVTFYIGNAFQKYCRFCALARHFFPTHL